MADQRVGIVIDARDQASATIGRARVELDRYSAEIAKLRREASKGTDVSKQLGDAILKQSAAAKASADALRGAASGNSALASSARGAVDALSAQAGPMAGMARALVGIGGPLGVATASLAALAGVLVMGAKGIADYQEKLDLAAVTTGLTTGQLAGLTVAASENGRSFDQIKPAIDYFTRKIGEVANGTPEAVKAFYDLGISVRDVNGSIRPTGDILRDAQAKLAALPSTAQRSAAAMELFGRSGAASLAVLMTSMDESEAKAREMNLALGPEAEAAARKADIAFDNLNTSVAGLKNSFGILSVMIAGGFVDSLSKATGALARFVADPNWKDLKEVMVRWSGHAELVPLLGGSKGPSEGNRPWVEGWQPSAEPDKPKTKPWDESWGGSYSETPQFSNFNPKHLDLKAIDGGWSPGGKGTGDQAFQDAFKGASAEADRLTKSFEGFADVGERAAEKTGEFTEKASEFAIAVGTGVADAMAGLVSMMIHGVDDIGAAFEALLVDIVASIAAQMVKKGVMSLLGLPLQQGGTVALQAGGTIAASWANPIMAQTGLVVAGTRGVDTVPAMLGRGETVISHSQTDYMNRVMQKMDAFISKAVSPSPQMAMAGSAGTLQVNLTYSGGGTLERDRLKLSQWMRDDVVPVLRGVLSKGARG